MKILVTGATGCIGRQLVPFLRGRGHDVVRGMRRPEKPADRRVDLDDEATLGPGLAGCDAAVYLVHGLARGADYATWELRVATSFARACAAAGVARIVYLGGVQPARGASAHLRARAATGEALRSVAGVDVVELRAGMIVAAESASFVLARDVAARLPLLLCPPWLRARQRPVGIVDVVAAIERGLTVPAGIYACPGPETLGGDETLEILGRLLRRRRLHARGIPGVDHRLVARALARVTDAPSDVVTELVQGMTGDLIGADDPDIFETMPGHVRQPFAFAARGALRAASPPSTPAWLWERLVRAVEGAAP